MTPEEKARELVSVFRDYAEENSLKASKTCATICVNEILDQANKILLPRKFWEDVKEAIQKL